MKTLNDFLASVNNEFSLNNQELNAVRGGQVPPTGEPNDPWLEKGKRHNRK